jgi:hypothetical protein
MYTNINKRNIGFGVLTEVVMKCTIFCLPPAFTLVSCSDYFSFMKTEAIRSSETSVDTQRTTWSYIPEDDNLQTNESLHIAFG